MGTIIPLSDASRRPAHFPLMTLLIIVINGFVFVQELLGGEAFVLNWAAVPANIVGGHHWITLLTAMFIHGSWSHIIGNMIFLWAFGPEIEDAMNPLRYVAFYLLGGLVAMLAQVIANSHSTVPNLGASGAIAAVMGAFLVTYPRDRIRVLLASHLPFCPCDTHSGRASDRCVVPHPTVQCGQRGHGPDRRYSLSRTRRRIHIWGRIRAIVRGS